MAGLIADKAFDSHALLAALNARGARIVSSQHPGRAWKLGIDRDLSRWRRLIENVFCTLTAFSRVAMRACGTDQGFAAIMHAR